jgi:hypothetical protein
MEIKHKIEELKIEMLQSYLEQMIELRNIRTLLFALQLTDIGYSKSGAIMAFANTNI